MSTTIDNKIVEMRFDNRNFEQNVKTSMSTLDKLKRSLRLDGAAKGLESIQSSANKINFSGMSKGIDTVTTRFSYFQATVQHQLNNIVDSAVNAGRRMVSALTIDPVKTGFQEYETQINAVQTILANTKSKGSTLDDVNNALDELNTYADKTIYNFTEMTRNIGTFTAAGVDLDTSVSSIKGIANLAAVSGSTSQQASTAMYQLSQALAAGKVSLMDWNSVVNAGMGGQIFQDALVRTSEMLGTGAKEAIEKYGTFRESLTKGEWLTTEVLTETLTQLSGAYSEADLIAQGFTKKQAKEIRELADTAVGAATEVKTFTQLWDTLKEAAQSGWTQSWEILIGDFEEAKSLLTNISNVVGDYINKMSEARNNVLQGWKDAGGRDDLLASFKNTFEAISSFIKPIKEAYYEIFPKKSLKEKVKILTDFTTKLKDFTSNLKIGSDTAKQIKMVFKGVFSVFDIGISAIKSIGKGVISLTKNFTGLSSGFLKTASDVGEFITNLRDGINESNLFDNIINRVVDVISGGIARVKEFGTSVKNSFKLPEANSFVKFFKGLLSMVTEIGSSIFEALGTIASAIADIFGKGDIFEVINSGLFGALLLSLRDYVKGLTDPFESTQNFFSKIKDVLDGARSSLEEWQNNLKSGTLLKIAGAIGILATSLFILSTIDADSLGRSLAAMAGLFTELMLSLYAFTKINPDLKGTVKTVTLLIGLSIAINLLAKAMKNISSISWGGIAKGLVTIGVLLAELSIFLNTAKFNKKLTKTALGIVLLSSSILILAKAMQNFGEMKWNEIGKGLIAIGGLLSEISIFTKLSGNAKHVISTGVSMIALASAMKILSSAMKDFGEMKWNQIGKSLVAMGGALAELVIALRILPKGTIFNAAGLLIATAALKVLYTTLSDFGGMSWSQIGIGLVVMGGALAELAIGLNLMRGTVGGSTSLLIAAAALKLFVPVIKNFGSFSWEEIGKGLITLAGAFTIIGVAGLLLGPIVPAIIGLSAAILLLGIGVSGIGVGLSLIAAGIAALSASIAAGSTVIIASLQAIILGILNLVPAIAKIIGRTIIEVAVILGDAAPKLAESFCKLIVGVVNSLATYTPQLVDSLLSLLIDVINTLADHTPELIKAFVNLFAKVFEGVVEVLNNADTDNMLKGIAAVGLMAVIARLLSGILALLPSAMTGLLGVGVLIAELAVVLAAIGGLAQIPGLSWLIDEGGEFLAKIGNALGKGIGSLIGGIGEGLSGSLPQIGQDIADFMDKLANASDNASGIDPTAFDGVTKLMEVMGNIAVTTVGTSISDIFTLGGTSMEKFETDGVMFFNAMRSISNSAVGITMDEQSIDVVLKVASKLSELQASLEPIGGVISWFAGRDDLGTFGINAGIFIISMKTAFQTLEGVSFNQEALNAVISGATSLSTLQSSLEPIGGIISWFAGRDDLGTFGQNVCKFISSMKIALSSLDGVTLNQEALNAVINSAKSLSSLQSTLEPIGGVISWFAGRDDLATFGANVYRFITSIKIALSSLDGITFNQEALSAIITASTELSKLQSTLEPIGGVITWFSGRDDLATFGINIGQFIQSMKTALSSLEGFEINADAMSAIITASTKLASLQSSLESVGGVIDWFTGRDDLGTFGVNAGQFITSMQTAFSNLGDTVINVESMNSIISAATSLASLQSSLSSVGGVIDWFTGRDDLGTFGVNIGLFAEAMGKLKTGMGEDGISEAVVASITNAGNALLALDKALPEEGFFDSKITMSDFSSYISDFSSAMSNFSSAASQINPEGIDIAITAAQRIRRLISSITNLDTSGVVEFTGVGTGGFGADGAAYKIAQAISAFSKKVAGVDTNAVSVSVSAAGKLKRLISSLIGLDYSGVEDFKKVKGIGSAIKAYSDKVTDIPASIIASSVTSAIRLRNLVSSLKGLDASGISNFKIASIGTALKNYSASVSGFNIIAVYTSISAANRLKTFINSLASMDTSGVATFKSAVNSLSKTNVSGMIDAFKGSTGKLTNVGSNLMNSLTRGIKSRSSSVTASANSIVNSMLTSIKGKTSQFATTGSMLAANLATGIRKQSNTVNSAANSLASGAATSARGYYWSFYNAGSYIASGLASGIRANIQSAANAAAEMAAAAVAAARENLQINSPSKVFKAIGSGIPEGFALGIGMLGSLVKQSVTKMSDKAVDSTREAISRVYDVMNGDLDMQPSIRPVLDLSDVHSGVTSMNRMFNSGITIGASADIGSINAMMNQRIQNGSNDDVVTAINKLRKDLSNVGNTSYTINGVTYDDGSNISDAVKSIVRAARVERRM